MVRRTKTAQPLTTVQQLGSLMKSARDIMRKDKGLSGDLDRLPMLTWIMFLKFPGDLEQMHEQEAIMAIKHKWRIFGIRLEKLRFERGLLCQVYTIHRYQP